MMNDWNIEGVECVQIHSPLKAAQKLKNRVEKRKASKETEVAREFSATTAVATTTVWPWQPPQVTRGGLYPAAFVFLRFRYSSSLSLDRDTCYAMPVLSHFCPS